MTDRETILRIIGAIGGDPFFWVNAPTCRDALDKAEGILREYRADGKRFCHEWYAVRWERLRQLIKDEAPGIEDKACCIMANGTADHMEPPTYAQILAEKDAEIRRLQAIVNGFADRIAAQSELLSKKAAKDDHHELVALISFVRFGLGAASGADHDVSGHQH